MTVTSDAHDTQSSQNLQSLQSSQIQKIRWIADRGERPLVRGWAHLFAAQVATIAATVLITYSWMMRPWWEALGITIYGLGLTALFTVSATYHRFPWRTQRGVEGWRRADHSMIAVFIASTYTPMCVIALPPKMAAITLTVAWGGALANVALKLLWPGHPRWLSPIIYVGLGWIVIPLIPTLLRSGNSAVLWLLFAGGVLYTVGAAIYGFKWPGRQARYYGYHEHFHTLTIIAAITHFVAIWLLIT